MPPEVKRAPFLIVEGYEVDVDTLTDAQRTVIGAFSRHVLVRLSALSDTSVTVRLDGHTDDTGGLEYNQDLGMRRAQNVETNLRLWFGGGPVARRVSYRLKSFGKTQPAQPNKTKAGRARNRRVEVRTEWRIVVQPKPRKPPPPRPVVLVPVWRPGPCVDLDKLLARGQFEEDLRQFTNVRALTRPIWLGEGEPITLEVPNERALRDTLSEGTVEKIFETVTDEALGGIPKVIEVPDIAGQALEFWGAVYRDQTNEAIMREDARRNDRHDKLAWRVVAEERVQNSQVNPMTEYLRLWDLYGNYLRLLAACDKAEGSKPASVGPASPEARPPTR